MKDTIESWVGSGISMIGAVMASLSTEQILRIISLAISIIAGFVSLIYTLVMLHDKHMEDGKITADELKESIDEVLRETESAKDKIDEITKIVDTAKEPRGDNQDGNND